MHRRRGPRRRRRRRSLFGLMERVKRKYGVTGYFWTWYAIIVAPLIFIIAAFAFFNSNGDSRFEYVFLVLIIVPLLFLLGLVQVIFPKSVWKFRRLFWLWGRNREPSDMNLFIIQFFGVVEIMVLYLFVLAILSAF